jgi:hypothetical protein
VRSEKWEVIDGWPKAARHCALILVIIANVISGRHCERNEVKRSNLLNPALRCYEAAAVPFHNGLLSF